MSASKNNAVAEKSLSQPSCTKAPHNPNRLLMEEDIAHLIIEVKDTRKRLELAQTMVQYFSRDDWRHQHIKDFRNLISGLANWIKSSSLQVKIVYVVYINS